MEQEIKAVIMHGFTDEEAFIIMRAVKALGYGSKTTAFATTTPTSMKWKVEDLIGHLAEEHSAMLRADQKKAEK